MSRKFWAFLFLLHATFVAQSSAQERDLADVYRREAHAILSDLPLTGIPHFGPTLGAKKTPAQILEEFKSIRFVSVSDFSKPAGANRRSAFNDPTNKIIYVNTRERPPLEIIPVLALHEVFGVLGLGDIHYQTSMGLKLLIDELKGEGLEKLDAHDLKIARSMIRSRESSQALRLARDGIDRTNPDNILARGGGDIVGGGGDWMAVAFKFKLLTRLQKTTDLSPNRERRVGYLYARVLGIGINLTDSKEEAIDYSKVWDAKIGIQIPRWMALKALASTDSGNDPAIQDLTFFWRTYLNGSDVQGLPAKANDCHDEKAFSDANFLGIHPASAEVWKSRVKDDIETEMIRLFGRGCRDEGQAF